jgi:CheY-like chemotaxis protein
MYKQALICEDNAITASVISSMLEKLEYKSDIVSTADEALEKISKIKYDLMTLDIMLPGKNGLEVIKKMQDIEFAKSLPVIVISAVEKKNVDLNFKNDNIIYWLEKKLDKDSLKEAIECISEKQKEGNIEVLHVENSDDLRYLVELTLGDIANVTPAGTLGEAKNLIENKKFDMIILDYVFAEGTSDKLIPSIKYGINKNAKIIIHSAYEDANILSRYVDKILIKGKVSFDELKTCVENFVAKKG